MLNTSSHSVTVSLPPALKPTTCALGNLLPATTYRFYAAPAKALPAGGATEVAAWCKETSACVTSSVRIATGGGGTAAAAHVIGGLVPNEDYRIGLEIGNAYHPAATGGGAIELAAATADGVPGAPRDVVATCLDPTSVLVRWLAPVQFNADALSYEVHYRHDRHVLVEPAAGGGDAGGKNLPGSSPGRPLNVTLTGLDPGAEYRVWVVARSRAPEPGPASQAVAVDTFRLPEPPRATAASPRSLDLSWTAPEEGQVARYSLLVYPR